MKNKPHHQQDDPEQQPLNQQPHALGSAGPIRFIYNSTPSTKDLAYSAAIPNAVHYTPFHADLEPEVVAHTDSLKCTSCHSFLNRYCQLNKNQSQWSCCICKQVNRLDKNINKRALQDETYDIYSKSRHMDTKTPKLYLFLIDLCVSSKQMKAIQQSLLQFLKAKSQQKFEGVNLVHKIGIITFSKFVYCYELSSQINTVISVAADKDYDSQNFNSFLGLDSTDGQEIVQKYFLDIQSGREKIEKRIKNIKAQGDVQNQKDSQHRCRSKRAYGQALNLALNLCENIQAQCRVINLVGGPCTHGMGTTIGTSFKQHMRSIRDLEKGENIHYYQSASNFYKYLKLRAQGKRVVLDFFIFCVEETGLTQMYDLIRTAGGLVVLGEQFSGQLQIFPKSFAKAYIQSETNDVACSLGGSCAISVSCSKDIKINGAVGDCNPIESTKGREYVSDKAIGHGDTNIWAIGGTDCYRTLTFFYELSSNKASDSVYYIQFKTIYRDYWGFKKTRVTTVKKIFANNLAVISDGFDQEAAIVAVARWYLFKSSFESRSNLRLWMDKLLVRWASNFAQYTKGDYHSFSLCQKMKYLPQFFYHLRRNPVIRRTGLSLDELTYQTHTLNIETVQHCITIIQPALLSYTIEEPYPSPVRLQEEQMKNEAILVLDTHFHVIVWYGQNIEYWEKQEFHKQKEYLHVKALMEAPQQDVEYLLNSRFPYPGYYKTSRGSSKQRILKSKISPVAAESQNENVITDDKSFYAFMKALVQIIVYNKAS